MAMKTRRDAVLPRPTAIPQKCRLPTIARSSRASARSPTATMVGQRMMRHRPQKSRSPTSSSTSTNPSPTRSSIPAAAARTARSALALRALSLPDSAVPMEMGAQPTRPNPLAIGAVAEQVALTSGTLKDELAEVDFLLQRSLEEVPQATRQAADPPPHSKSVQARQLRLQELEAQVSASGRSGHRRRHG